MEAELANPSVDKRTLFAIQEQATELKRKLSLIPAVTWRDHDVHRSTLVEILKKSAYRSVAFVDELGTRTACNMLIPVKLSQEASLASLTLRDTNDVSLIRSSTSGGASIHSLVGSDDVTFYYISSLNESLAQLLCKRITTKSSNSALRGTTVLVPAPDSETSVLPYSQNEIFEILKRVYARGDKPGRSLPVLFESPELETEWNKFLKLTYKDLSGKDPSEAAQEALKTLPTSLPTLALFASRAATTRAVYDKILQDGGAHSITLTQADLKRARDFATAAFILTGATAFLDVRSSNLTKAREALAPSAVRMHEAMDLLESVIAASPEGLISRKAAVKLKGVTAGILDTLVARGGKLVELCGKENIRCGKISRAYALKSESAVDPEEAIAEFEQATSSEDPVDPVEVDSIFKDLQARAVQIDDEHFVCAVPITRMTSRQIQHLPALIQANPADVALRGTAELPEPPHLLEADEETACFLEAGVPNLWFRFRPDGKPFRDWNRSRLEFPQWTTPDQ